MSVRKSLEKVYDDQALHFASTRKKPRPELQYIVDYISAYAAKIGKRKLHIVEVGCGAGRLATLLEIAGIKMDYHGVDISAGLLEIADQEYPKGHFHHQDMCDYLASCPQESVDIVIGVASIQHLPRAQRVLFWHLAQRALTYGGLMIQINRHFSTRFRKKYRAEVVRSRVRFGLSLGYRDWRDLTIPRIDPTTHKVYPRYYHIFSEQELRDLSTQAGFVVDDVCYYVDDKHPDEEAKNSILLARKDVS